MVPPLRSVHRFVTSKTQAGPSASRKALLVLYFGRHRRFKEAKKKKKKAFKIVKGKKNWISPARLKRLGLLHLEREWALMRGLTSQRGEGAPKGE